MADALQPANSATNFPSISSTYGSNVFCSGAVAKVAAEISSEGSGTIYGAGTSAIDKARTAALAQTWVDRDRGPIQTAYAGKAAETLAQSGTINTVLNTSLTRVFFESGLGQQLYRVAQMLRPAVPSAQHGRCFMSS